MAVPLLLGHVLSQDNPWIPLLTVGGIAVLVVFGLVASGRLRIDEPGDLLLPGASVVLLAGLAGSLAEADWLLDQAPWVVPAALVVVVALVVASSVETVRVGPSSPRTSAMVAAVAVVAGAVSFAPLDDAWFGEEAEVLAIEPGPVEVSLRLAEPIADDGSFAVEVALEGGTLGDNLVRATRPEDPMREMTVKFLVDGVPQFPRLPPSCADDPDCDRATVQLSVTPGTQPRLVAAEFLTADQVAYTSPVRATLEGDALSAS